MNSKLTEYLKSKGYVSEPIGNTCQNQNSVLYKRPDGIFVIELAECVTLLSVINVTSEILAKYAQIKKNTLPLRVLADGSKVKSYTPEALLIGTYTIGNYPNLKLALINQSNEYLKIEEEFYQNHCHPKNLENFRNEVSAISWLNS